MLTSKSGLSVGGTLAELMLHRCLRFDNLRNEILKYVVNKENTFMLSKQSEL